MFLKDQFKLLTACSIPYSIVAIFRKRIHFVIMNILTVSTLIFIVL